MNSQPQSLIFDIDVEHLKAIQSYLGATESQLRASYNRALSRTAVTVRTLTNKAIRDAMQVKNLKAIRKRFQTFRLKSPSKQKKLDELRLWFGLNDMSVGYLKGRASRIGSKSNPAGALFTPKGDISAQSYDDGFVARRYNRRSIFTRTTEKRFPIKEARVSISEDLQNTIEDDIFERLPEIFMHHFETDLKGRVKMNLNRTNWHE